MKQLAFAVLKYFSLLTVLGLLLSFLATAATVYPKLPLLKQRDEKRYAHMVTRAKSLALVEAYEVFQFLREHTKKEIEELDYRRIKKRLRSDEEFRKENQIRIMEAKGKRAKRMPVVYAARQKEVSLSFKPQSQKRRKATWERLSPWEKNMLLREKCRESLAMENRDNERQKRTQDVPFGSAPPSADFCSETVPLSHDASSPDQTLKDLKNKMNYFYFARMVEDLGFESGALTPQREETKRMTADFN